MATTSGLTSNVRRIYRQQCESVYVSIPVMKHDVDYIFFLSRNLSTLIKRLVMVHLKNMFNTGCQEML
jgi:hypothetical protein